MSAVGQRPSHLDDPRPAPGQGPGPASEQSPAPPDKTVLDGLPPGPRLPRWLQTLLVWNRTNAFLERCQRRYGPVFTIRALPWGRAVHVNDAELIKQIFTGDPSLLHAGEGNSILGPVLGLSSVLVLDEDEHLQARKRLLPPFHGDAVKRYEEVVERITVQECAGWPVGRPFELHPHMRDLTFEVILEAVIGVTDPVRQRALRDVLPKTVELDFVTLLVWLAPWLGRFGRWKRFRRSVEEANELLREEIAARRLDPLLGEREDVLSQLVRAGDFDDEELRDQIMTLLLAGHETTATGLAWAFERMVRNPQVMERARQGDDEYLDAVVRETLRVRPVIPAVLRQLQGPLQLGRWRLPKRVTVMPAISLMHSDPSVFADPDSFRPERFLEGEGSTYTWIPFGGGRRRCLGAAFASFEMRVVLRTVLAHVALRADRPRDEGVRNRHITLVPARGARVVRTG